MRLLIFIGFLFLPWSIFSQSITDLKQRFDTYLNFNGSLNSHVSFTHNSITINNNEKAEFTAYENEWPVLSNLLLRLKPTEFLLFYSWKNSRHLSTNQLDSLNRIYQTTSINTASLSGKKIAIDPGHFAGNMDVARIEQKFIDFSPSSLYNIKDSIRFNEGTLTYQTADILKHKLEEQGVIVMVTRPQQNYTAFQITYDDWIITRKKNVLDSLLKVDAINTKRYSALMNMPKEKLFWEFFRDFELMERSRLINEFKPDITVIIHYNVDEKNTDWKQPTQNNYTMTFIPGGITGDNFSKKINKIHFLRLLLTDQVNQSEKLSSLTVNQFNQQMHIPIAKKSDANYLKDNCLKTPSAGVFCRNLALCRTINSPLVYGECLYQDNIKECVNLCTNDYKVYDKAVPKRIYQAANCYYTAIIEYFKK